MEHSAEEWGRTYVEVLAIINSMSARQRSKIPEDLIAFLEKNKDPNYQYEPQGEITSWDQLCKLTRNTLMHICYKYIWSDEMREAFDVQMAALLQ